MTDYEHHGDNRRNEGGMGTALAFLMLGLGAGALVALMLAPTTGRRMRRTLRRHYEDAREAVGEFSDSASQVVERGASYAHAVRERVEPISRAFTRRPG